MADFLIATREERTRPGECAASLAFDVCSYAGAWPKCAASKGLYLSCPYSAEKNPFRPVYGEDTALKQKSPPSGEPEGGLIWQP